VAGLGRILPRGGFAIKFPNLCFKAFFGSLWSSMWQYY
jgi:hypothetical protein